MQVRLIFLRHGRTQTNATARLQGRLDSPLDDVGIMQAKRAGEGLRARFAVDRVVTSNLVRTRQTIEAAGLGGYPRGVDDRWLELDFGEYDNRLVKEVMGELEAAWVDDIEWAPPGGESLGVLYRRVAAACDELLASGTGETVVVVTHANPIKAAVVWALGGGPEMMLRMRVDVASVSEIELGAGGLLVTAFNERSHEIESTGGQLH